MEKIRIFLAGWEVHWSAEYRRMALSRVSNILPLILWKMQDLKCQSNVIKGQKERFFSAILKSVLMPEPVL